LLNTKISEIGLFIQ